MYRFDRFERFLELFFAELPERGDTGPRCGNHLPGQLRAHPIGAQGDPASAPVCRLERHHAPAPRRPGERRRGGNPRARPPGGGARSGARGGAGALRSL
eukprot:1184938-Prorocentrum_minimum.AAC.2